MIEYDPFSAEVKADPQRYFRELREQCPVHHHVLAKVDRDRINESPLVRHPTEEFWSVFRYAACREILQNPGLYSSKEGPGPERLEALNGDGMLIYSDPPAHRRQRQIVNKAFLPRMVEVRKPYIQRVVDELIDGFANRGEVELYRGFAVPLTIRVIASIFGAGEDRIDDLFRWGNDTVAAFGGEPDALKRGFEAMQELFAFVMEQIEYRRKVNADGGEPPDDVLTSMVFAESDGAKLSDEEILMACQQVLTAGFETTSTAICSTIYRLCTNPAERERLEARPTLIDNAIEEALRYDPPIEGLFRTTTEDTVIDGCPIPRGAKVRVVYASANHDLEKFDDPEVFKIDRDPALVRQHFAFGHGSHACIGSALARAELRIGVGTLLARLPGLELDESKPRKRNPALIVNGFNVFPIRWDAASVRPASEA